jgi:hypothetical protein
MNESRLKIKNSAALETKEIGQKFLAMRSQNRFGMKLDPPDRQLLVAKPHDLSLRSLGRDFKAIREGFPLYKKTVITSGLKRIRKSLEQIPPVMKDWRGLAMHKTFCPHHLPSVDIAHALMAKTDTQDGISPGEALDHFTAYSCFLRGTRTGRYADPFG